MSVAPQKQPCEVCGALTTFRCSACEKVGILLHFCSGEHQSLVWHVHRLVCGPKAHPISLPPLTPDELADAKRRANDPLKSLDEGPMTLAFDLQMISKKPLDHILEHLSGDANDSSELVRKPYLVCAVRSTRMAQLTTPLSFPLSDPRNPVPALYLASNGISHLCAALLAYRLLPQDLSQHVWFSLAAHKFLILGALKHRAIMLAASSDASADEQHEARAMYVKAVQRLLGWLSGGMDLGDPRMLEPLSKISRYFTP
ncbi:hypothetical protein Rhopal_001981-T1 [Rhodotorula paludigena]|uniref:MYND-type domain-containing protein n=1 Tax=Rhodotorula paludigena TaxID=86838 RepID=A0AAV5GHM9_9BASI|nr:hypothetical protein Rhopal_001981-T1 [Rhodotorula paludigena]